MDGVVLRASGRLGRRPRLSAPELRAALPVRFRCAASAAPGGVTSLAPSGAIQAGRSRIWTSKVAHGGNPEAPANGPGAEASRGPKDAGRADRNIRKYLGMGILSQAGVAIGLALVVKQTLTPLGPWGARIGALIITTVTATSIVFEIVGPILCKVGLQKAGEIPGPAHK